MNPHRIHYGNGNEVLPGVDAYTAQELIDVLKQCPPDTLVGATWEGIVVPLREAKFWQFGSGEFTSSVIVLNADNC